MTTRYKLLIILVAMLCIPLLLFNFNIDETFAFFATIFIEMLLGCWGIEILANRANKHFDH